MLQGDQRQVLGLAEEFTAGPYALKFVLLSCLVDDIETVFWNSCDYIRKLNEHFTPPIYDLLLRIMSLFAPFLLTLISI